MLVSVIFTYLPTYLPNAFSGRVCSTPTSSTGSGPLPGRHSTPHHKTRQFIGRLEKDFPGQSHHVRNDMVLLLVMAGNDYLKAGSLLATCLASRLVSSFVSPTGCVKIESFACPPLCQSGACSRPIDRSTD